MEGGHDGSTTLHGVQVNDSSAQYQFIPSNNLSSLIRVSISFVSSDEEPAVKITNYYMLSDSSIPIAENMDDKEIKRCAGKYYFTKISNKLKEYEAKKNNIKIIEIIKGELKKNKSVNDKILLKILEKRGNGLKLTDLKIKDRLLLEYAKEHIENKIKKAGKRMEMLDKIIECVKDPKQDAKIQEIEDMGIEVELKGGPNKYTVRELIVKIHGEEFCFYKAKRESENENILIYKKGFFKKIFTDNVPKYDIPVTLDILAYLCYTMELIFDDDVQTHNCLASSEVNDPLIYKQENIYKEKYEKMKEAYNRKELNDRECKEYKKAYIYYLYIINRKALDKLALKAFSGSALLEARIIGRVAAFFFEFKSGTSMKCYTSELKIGNSIGLVFDSTSIKNFPNGLTFCICDFAISEHTFSFFKSLLSQPLDLSVASNSGSYLENSLNA